MPTDDLLKPFLEGETLVNDSTYLKAVAQEWSAFRDGRSLGKNPTVRKDILDSWRRSRDALGVKEPQRIPARLNGEALERKLAENQELIASAGPVMEQYRLMLQSSHSVIMLADSDGVILHRCGAADVISRMPHLDIGVAATETVEGTNGIGLCCVLERQVEIFGSEHYNLRDHGWCCVSAPLYDGMSRFVGVLTVTLPLKEFHSHTTGMLMAAAHNINAQLRLRELLSTQATAFELLDEGVLILDRFGGIRAINSKGRSMLKLSSSSEPGNIADIVQPPSPFSSILSAKKNIAGRETLLQLRGGEMHCVLSAALIPNNKGVVVTLTGGGWSKTAQDGARAIYSFDDIVGISPLLRRAVKLAELAAKSDITTLILGESGTGKELFAHSIHNASSRRGKPFVIVNCGAIPRDLVQSELFGYEAGAFTGADKRGKAGKFELADGGTIFLDEIGEMPPEAQVSLLRLLQNHETSRLGGKSSRRIDVRVLAATNRNLPQAIKEGKFREDLYYRLNVMVISVPPLRERPEDIAPLAEHFLRKAGISRKTAQDFSSEAWRLLRHYAWPGNARELENVVERALHIATAPLIQASDLPPELEYDPSEAAPACARRPVQTATLRSHESEFLLATLRRCRGNIRAAAKELNISRSALYAKLARFGINYREFRQKT